MTRRAATSRALLALAALLMLAGGTAHSLAFDRAAGIVDVSDLSQRYAAIFKGLWWSDAAVVILIGLAYLCLALWPRHGTPMMFTILAALPLASAISIYSTVGNFAPAHLLMACGTMTVIAALLRTGEAYNRPPASGDTRWPKT